MKDYLLNILKVLSRCLLTVGNFWISKKEYIVGAILSLVWALCFITDLINSHDIIYALKESWILLATALFAFLAGYLMSHVFFIDFSKGNKNNE